MKKSTRTLTTVNGQPPQIVQSEAPLPHELQDVDDSALMDHLAQEAITDPYEMNRILKSMGSGAEIREVLKITITPE